ncbi:MAG: hypothetical protein ACYTEQ_24020 [Planctomycetota bacterium]|jgi:hypothetical protein
MTKQARTHLGSGLLFSLLLHLKGPRRAASQAEMAGKEGGEALFFVRTDVELLMRQTDGFIA